MSKYDVMILDENLEKGYTLIVKYNTITLEVSKNIPQPFIVAYSYNEDTKSWVHGHYFSKLQSAVEFMYSEN